MLDYSNLVEQSSYLNTFNDSLTWLASGIPGIDGLPQINKFSGSSADSGDFIDDLYSQSSIEYSPQVAPDPGSVFSTAYDIGNLTRPQTLADFVGDSDTSDTYRFDLLSYSSFNLSLNGLRADANVVLFDTNGSRITSSENSGTQMEAIDRSLNAGTYYVRVYQYTGNTSYRLGVSATPIANNTRTILGTLDANTFLYESNFSRTVISGNGNVDFGRGARDLLNLSNINFSTVTFNNAADSGGGLLYNLGNGTRLFDAITFNNGNQILFEGIDRIQFADRTINLSVTPNDPLFGQQWNLHMMGVQNAWRLATGSDRVLVGIEDSGLGIDANGSIHTDLRINIRFPSNYVEDSWDYNLSHGTEVQGIIAARTNNGSGMSGINWNSPVFHIDVIGGNANDQSLAEATRNLINAANQNGRRLVINMSLGTDGSFGQTNLSPSFNQLVANNPNVLFVIAAGNEGDAGRSGLNYPATLAGLYDNVIAVGASWRASDRNGNAITPGERFSYSQYGTGLTLMGPASVVTTRATRSSTGTVSFDYYPGPDGFNGTSAAAPNVTGVASLILSANPNLGAAQVKQILSQTAYDLGVSGYDPMYGNGFVNADAAVRRALALARGAT